MCDATFYLAPHLCIQILHAIFPLEISRFALLQCNWNIKDDTEYWLLWATLMTIKLDFTRK